VNQHHCVCAEVFDDFDGGFNVSEGFSEVASIAFDSSIIIERESFLGVRASWA